VSTPHKSFWSSIPGLVTAVAGILTGVVGLGTLLVQLGVVGDKDTSSNPTTESTSVAGGSGSSGATPGSGATAGTVSFTVEPSDVTLKGLGSKTEDVKVTNRGTAALTVKPPQLTGADRAKFSVDATDCSNAKVAIGGSCQITVTFDGSGEAGATLTISADGASAPERVTLKGTLL